MAFFRCSSGSGGGSMTETILWTNSDPTSSTGFGQQAVDLSGSLSSYDMICVEYASLYSTTDSPRKIYMAVDEFVDNYGLLTLGARAGTSYRTRVCVYVSDTQVRFYTGYVVGATAGNATYCVPMNIYGVTL